jgi:ABC-2 type transport system ATP-binding protein
MENDILIEARALSRRYGATAAVSDLNLTLRKGEILGLLGPNGAGKSTTMKMLAGVLAPTGGSVRINGISLSADARGAKRNLGYLPEQPPVYPELTVDEYLRYCAGLHGVASSARAAAMQRAKQSCGLTDVAGRLIGNLSKGYQQRVGIAQAIIHRPAVVILDEPTVGLDPIQIREIRTLIKELGEEHSVILSSHILPEIQAVCSRVMIINKGHAVYSEPLKEAGTEGFSTVLATFRNAPPVSSLGSFAGVKSFDALGGGQVRFHLADGADPREAIADAAVRGSWGLIELRAEIRTLEEIFVVLTSGERLEPTASTLKEAA